MNLPIQIENITFFNYDSKKCISEFEQAPWTQKALSAIQSFGTFFLYYLDKLYLFLSRAESQIAPYTKAHSTLPFSKQKLVVCLHGLNNSPIQFKKIIDNLKPDDNSDLYIPYILQKGNGKLKDMTAPIFKEIFHWANQPGDKELVLVGISNGARIARSIEAQLATFDNVNIKKIRVISIVGANKGSSLATLAHRLGLSWLMSRHIAEEMPIDSECNKELNKDWKEALDKSKIQRDYTFIASPHDWQVPNYTSSLPEIPADSKKHFVRYGIKSIHGHNSIVNACAKAIAKIIQFP